MNPPLARRDWAVVAALTIGTLLVSAGVGIAGTSATSRMRPQPSPTASTAGGAVVTNEKSLSVAAVGLILDQHSTARNEQDVFAFTNSTCAGFIGDDSRRRGANSPTELLGFYARADQYAPPYITNQTTVLTSAVTAPRSATAQLRVNLTDNTHTPPVTEDRLIKLPLVFEGNLWKMCPQVGGLW